MNLDAAPVGTPAITPGDSIVTRDRTGRVIKRADDGRMSAARDVHHRHRFPHRLGVDRLARDPEVLVYFGAPAHRAHGRVRVRQRVVAAGRIKQIEIEILRQVLPQPHALVVELHAFGRQIVGADDRRVAGGIAAAEVALLQDGDIPDAVVAREIVRGCQSMPATADDDDVVARTSAARAA